MKRVSLAAISLLLFIVTALRAQTPNPLSFFPHHQNDIWEYYSPQDTSYREQNIITSDSLGADGRYYIGTTMFGPMRLDTTTFEVRGQRWAGGLYENLIYELDADSGDEWVVRRYGPGITRLAIVVAVFQTFIFGNNLVTMKQINYVDSASGLLAETDYLASDFGLVGEDFDAFPYLRIRGTRINGIQHGLITSIETEEPLQMTANLLQLHQNFPNPFNPTTVIRYELPVSGLVQLQIHNIAGQLVRTLVSEYQHRGNYEAIFDAQALASGLYFCRLSAPGVRLTRKMVLLR